MRGSRVMTVLISLACGAVASLAVAVGCAAWPAALLPTFSEGTPWSADNLWPPLQSGVRQLPEEEFIARKQQATLRMGNLASILEKREWELNIGVMRSLGREFERCDLLSVPCPMVSGSWYKLAVGWPWRCLHAEGGGDTDWEIRGTVRVPTWLRPAADRFEFTAAVLPLQIVPSGLAADAVSYGILAFAVGRAARAASDRFRRRRGRCPACNYDRRGLGPDAPCPECGAPRVEA